VLGEVLGTSDAPPGVVNLLSGQRRELVSWLAAHMDVNAVDPSGCSGEEVRAVEEAAASNVKRVVPGGVGDQLSLQAITAFMELKTIWHPVGV
jgi:acyl-CoA reductase-like NAD-dependent aldehyde dehydrogenase